MTHFFHIIPPPPPPFVTWLNMFLLYVGISQGVCEKDGKPQTTIAPSTTTEKPSDEKVYLRVNIKKSCIDKVTLNLLKNNCGKVTPNLLKSYCDKVTPNLLKSNCNK